MNLVQRLSKLVQKEDDFMTAFTMSVQESSNHNGGAAAGMGGDQSAIKPTASVINTRMSNQLEVLVSASKQFSIGNMMHIFNEEEAIFFMDKPIASVHFKSTKKCATCNVAWKNHKELKDSHC